MFVVKTIKLSKKYSNQNHIVLLFDASATVPCLYPLLYSTAVLRFQSFATQLNRTGFVGDHFSWENVPMKKVKYTPEIRDRAVQLLIESEKDYPSTWAAITAIAPKIGCTPETLRVWYQKYLDKQNPIKVQQLSDQERIKQLERENKELQRANEILRKAAAFFAQAELDRPHK